LRAIGDINGIVIGLPANTQLVVIVGLLSNTPSLLDTHIGLPPNALFIVVFELSLPPHSLSCNHRHCWALVIVPLPVVRLPFSRTRPTPVAFLYGWLLLNLATMSDSCPKTLKVNFMFVPWPLKAVQVDKQMVKL
jgi:hypothetical protein